MKAFILLAVASVLQCAELRVDHVTIAGSSLDAMEKQLASTGLKVEAGGAHANHATQMALASFPDGSYLELMAPQEHFDPAELAKHPWARFIDGNAGPCAWAVRPKDFDAEAARIRTAGLPITIVPGGRERPDGVKLRWERAVVGNEGDGAFYPFLIRDITSRDKRAFLSGKPANKDYTGILRVVIAVSKLSEAVDKFRLAYNVGKPLKQVDPVFGAEIAWFADTPVVLAAPLGASSHVAQRIRHFGEGPCAVVLATKKSSKDNFATHSLWLGRNVEWYDAEKLGGWWLGLQREL